MVYSTKTNNSHGTPLVAIRCIAYNQASYIRQTLDGFVMQRTDFSFVAIVHDDASTDGTADIICEYASKYPNIIYPIIETENQYSKPGNPLGQIMSKALNATGAKYVAYCEGDDYWIDPFKLQKQIDFLEENPDYSLVCTKCDKFIQKSGKILNNIDWGKNGVITFNDLVVSNQIATLTVVLRTNVLNKYIKFIGNAPTWSFGDYPIWLYAATLGNIMKLPDSTAVYRVLEKSASHLTDDKSKISWAYSSFSMFDYFDKKFKIPKSLRREAIFYKCHKYGSLAIVNNDIYLTNRIKNFYLENNFFIAWISFKILCDCPKLSFISNFIESHIAVKSPLFYLRKKLRQLYNVGKTNI